jgi:hypothetical protein
MSGCVSRGSGASGMGVVGSVTPGDSPRDKATRGLSSLCVEAPVRDAVISGEATAPSGVARREGEVVGGALWGTTGISEGLNGDVCVPGVANALEGCTRRDGVPCKASLREDDCGAM